MFLERIEEDKQQYLTVLRNYSGKELYIFGKGEYSEYLRNFLKKEGYTVSGYFTSFANEGDAKNNARCITRYDEKKDKNIVILIGTKYTKNDDIKNFLNSLGWKTVIDVPKHLKFFSKEIIQDNLVPELEITTTIGCRVNCRYCPQKMLIERYKSSDVKTMQYDDYCKAIDKLPENTIITFSGFAEPFLNPLAIGMMDYAFKKGHKVNLFTTFEGLLFEDFKRLEKIEFNTIVLHLPDKNKYANITVDDNYMRILDKAINQKKKNGESWISYANSQFEADERIVALIGDKVRITGQMIDRAGNLEDDKLLSIDNCIKKGSHSYCERSLVLNHNVLLPNGDVVLCCMDFGIQNVIGNLFRQSYEEIINSNRLKEILEQLDEAHLDNTICRHCINLQVW